MSLWSLSEEKVEELIELMKKKKQELDTLKETHIFTLWNNDLDEFLNVLQKYEEDEEKDRKAHKRQNKGEPNQRQKKRVKAKGNKNEEQVAKKNVKAKKDVTPSTTSDITSN